MNKKILWVTLSVILCLGVIAAVFLIGNANTKENTSSSQAYDEQKVLSQLGIKEQLFDPFLALTIKNNSNCNVSLTVNVAFLDGSGNIVSSEEKSFEQFEKGYEKTFAFKCEKDFVKTSYTCSVKEYTKPCYLSKVEIAFTGISGKHASFESNTRDIPTNIDEKRIVIKDYTIFLTRNGKIVDVFECKHEKYVDKSQHQQYTGELNIIKDVPAYDGYLLAVESIHFS